MKFRHPRFKYVFLWLDICTFAIASIFSIYVIVPDFWERTRENWFFGVSHITFCFFLICIFVFAFRFNTLYLRNVLSTHYRQFILILKSHFFGTMAAVFFLAVFNMKYLSGYGMYQLENFNICSIPLLFFYRVIFAKEILRLLLKSKMYAQRVLIVGGDEAGRHCARSLMNDTSIQCHVTGFLDDYKEKGVEIFEGYRNLGKLKDIQNIIREHDVNEILIAINNAPYTRLIFIVETCLQSEIPVRIYSDLLNVVAEKMKVEYYSNIPVVDLPQHPLTGKTWSDKRTLDIVLSLLALVGLSPVFFIIAIAIKISSRGPVIFKQTRIGKNGRPFDFYKFRSMHIGDDDSRHKEYVTNFIKNKNGGSGRDINVFKITDDPRIFKFGKFIRKTSLDEFPQLFNVLKGDMSLVGPRPCLPYEWKVYDEWHKNRLNVLPGCTGLWQALGRSTVSFEEMVILDLYYISNMSLWLDFRIVLQTFPVIFLGKGGY